MNTIEEQTAAHVRRMADIYARIITAKTPNEKAFAGLHFVKAIVENEDNWRARLAVNGQ